ncbi:MAG: HIT family hydrolase [Desulfobulbaceae bacterium]|nr:MAG: HIT family hydrolase [Desulfobulbaceae bacterium]
MKSLFAPWRMEYILGREGREPGCFMCAAPATECDKDSLLLLRDRESAVLLNRFPYANGHLLVAPGRHVADITDLTARENAALIKRVEQAVVILRRYLRPDGLNIGLNLGEVAGAGRADHLHYHIVPRWQGDHNFMTVLAEVRSIPDHLANTFDLLLPDFQALLAAEIRSEE